MGIFLLIIYKNQYLCGRKFKTLWHEKRRIFVDGDFWETFFGVLVVLNSGIFGTFENSLSLGSSNSFRDERTEGEPLARATGEES